MLSLSYWFSIPQGDSYGTYYYIGGSVLLLIGSLIARYFLKKNKKNIVIKKYLQPLPSGLFWFSFFGFLFSFFRYQQLYIFSLRIWIAVIVICFIWWALPKYLRFRKYFHQDLLNDKEKLSKNVYHPTKKKRKK